MSTPEKDTYDYVIVGAGVAAAGAVKGIRAHDEDGTILLLGAEPDGPVYRPDLSKKLWLEDDAELDASSLDTDDAELVTDTVVESIDPAAHRVTLAGGASLGYGALLLATGSEPRRLSVPEGPRVRYFRTAEDFRALRAVAGEGARVAVVGGGYIGGEMASALAQNGARVTMVLDGDYVQEHMFPRGLAESVTADFAGHDVDVRHGLVEDGEFSDDQVTLHLEDGTTLTADAVVIGIGVTPRTDLAEAAGLTVDDGIVVDEHLRTSVPDVYAAGDVAAYADPLLGRRRVEHVDNAEKMGEAAGRIMAGAETTYAYTPFFWSDLFDAGYEAIGDLSSDLHTVEDWADDDHKTGVVYYLDGGSVRGVLLWNVWDKVDDARALIAETGQEPLTDTESLKGRIPLS